MEKINRIDFEENYEILLGEKDKIFSGTSKVIFNQMQVYLKNRINGEIIETNIFSSDKKLGEAMAIEQFCKIENE